MFKRYRLLDYAAAKQAEERGQRELSRFGRDPGLARNPDYRGKGLQLEFTVEDKGAFTTPWKGTISYLRSAHTDWQERICAENVQHYYAGGHYYSDKDARIPSADRPDF